MYAARVKSGVIALVSTIVLATSCRKSNEARSGSAPSGEAANAALATPGVLAGFEGDVSILAKSGKDRPPMPPIVLTVKGTKMRFEMPQTMQGLHKQYAIVDASAKKFYTVVDDTKKVIVVDADYTPEQTKPSDSIPRPSGDAPRITKTGDTATVAGVSCEEWDVATAKGERGRVCVSNEDASWLELPNLGVSAERLWVKEIFDGKHLPLRLVSFDAAGAEESRLEVTKLERRAVLDSIFAIPAGYHTVGAAEAVADLAEALKKLEEATSASLAAGAAFNAKSTPKPIASQRVPK